MVARKTLPLAGVLLCLLALPVSSAEWVAFDDGRALKAEKVTNSGEYLQIELEAGGVILVPASSVVRREAVAAETVHSPLEQVNDQERETYWRALAGIYAELVAETSAKYSLEPALLAAVGQTESRFDTYAVSHAGACGLLQLMPDTADRFRVKDVFDPAQNIDGGARYLRWLLDRFDGDLEHALAGYNAGEGAVERYGGIPPYRETQKYVRDVLRHMRAGRTLES
jgi:soluble lytic murein transglycosylase-like protein